VISRAKFAPAKVGGTHCVFKQLVGGV